jgi:hypothetical protein
MAKPTKPAYDLADAEKRDLIQIVQEAHPLPEKYRFVYACRAHWGFVDIQDDVA